MVAPIDAKASFDADGETYELVMNFRTIALAEDQRPDAVMGFGSGKPSVSGLTALLWAFARPAHPTLTLDEAFSLAINHGTAAGKAIQAVFAAASAKGDGSAHPPKPQSRKRSAP